MDYRAAGLRAQARKCRDLASAAVVQSSIEVLLKMAREFDEAAERVERGDSPGATHVSLDGTAH
jgi:hypothetical protein